MIRVTKLVVSDGVTIDVDAATETGTISALGDGKLRDAAIAVVLQRNRGDDWEALNRAIGELGDLLQKRGVAERDLYGEVQF